MGSLFPILATGDGDNYDPNTDITPGGLHRKAGRCGSLYFRKYNSKEKVSLIFKVWY